ncbi:hypothetical protein CCR95_18800 [Thiocystis minor]|nr:hypothetical protein [Thiocystis minor]
MVLARVGKRLEDELAMTAEAAQWAVDAWALALGVIAQPSSIPKSAPVAPSPPPIAQKARPTPSTPLSVTHAVHQPSPSSTHGSRRGWLGVLVFVLVLLPFGMALLPITESKLPEINTEPQQPEIRYYDHGDGTVTDTTTDLMWKRCSEGQTWSGENCVGEASKMTWDQAMSNGRQKHWPTFAGHDDWRLPTLDELKTLAYCSSRQPQTWKMTAESCEGEYVRPTIVQAVFPNIPRLGGWFWSSSSYAISPRSAWEVDFGNGHVGYNGKSYAEYARLVRGGQ